MLGWKNPLSRVGGLLARAFEQLREAGLAKFILFMPAQGLSILLQKGIRPNQAVDHVRLPKLPHCCFEAG